MEMEFDMSDEKNEQPEIKEYADGWITEKKGTDAPIFLKIAYIVISLGCVSYLFIYMHGEVSHSERGALVQLLNETTAIPVATTMMYIVIAIAVIYVIALLIFTYSKFHED